MRNLTLVLVFVSLIFGPLSGQDMDFKTLKLALAQRAVVVEEQNNMVEYELDGVHIYLVTDESANRMRLMAGVVEQSKIEADEMVTLMQANFDKALDAKYALSKGVLWSVFAHPLKELEKEQIVDALYQVKNLVNNYGTTYTSTDFIFNTGEN
ncbi:hypothetical protein FNH22_30465 [Fulvivirga sp. M361]|uniref:hypothetical protein n=1 Tax=Fulvivirga sp. M361 TaxID=2594266 RepID=UPI001179F6A7|nr:hypothetical protein [Fulvivirga sp. M361]TRX47145.1 hypothetical protein FNH22_30465 [Fulvivirga sp. M361]